MGENDGRWAALWQRKRCDGKEDVPAMIGDSIHVTRNN
jgi:hypothetical protein